MYLYVVYLTLTDYFLSNHSTNILLYLSRACVSVCARVIRKKRNTGIQCLTLGKFFACFTSSIDYHIINGGGGGGGGSGDGDVRRFLFSVNYCTRTDDDDDDDDPAASARSVTMAIVVVVSRWACTVRRRVPRKKKQYYYYLLYYYYIIKLTPAA